MVRMENLSSVMKQSIMSLTFSVNMVQIFGSNGKQKTYSLKGLLLTTVQMVLLLKKWISWMFGSILGRPISLC
ncbi:hypothetical protein AOA59_26370 [Pseudomonas sp. 2822-15]|nr:hypothetical protein AOA59_26370 [Pseudomonas sp. 2822-15]